LVIDGFRPGSEKRWGKRKKKKVDNLEDVLDGKIMGRDKRDFQRIFRWQTEMP